MAGCFRPATPGFVVTLAATVLLAFVSFGVPWIKSVYFLKATVKGFDGSLTFGTLGYCMEQGGDQTCSKPTVGYEIDINTLLGNNTKIQIPNVVVKWITYCLVLHLVALCLSAISSVFGLLAHVSEFAGTCCSTCVSGFAAAVAFIAFIFDIALFFLTKSRINKESGGSAVIGNGIWLTLAAWICLFCAGFFYCFGSCCVSNRPSRKQRDREIESGHGTYADQMRLDAVKAEADRKAKQKLAGEAGLPAFHEYQPLNRKDSVDGHDYYQDGDSIVRAGDIGQNAGIGAGTSAYDRHGGGNQFAGGYAQAPAGTRAVDEYYSPTRQPSTGYPPHRQPSSHTVSASSYSVYSQPSSPPPVPQMPQNQYLAGANQYSHNSSPSSYQTAQPYPTNNYDGGYNPGFVPPTSTSYFNQPSHTPERSYTLGGGGYGGNVVPEQQHGTPYLQTQSPAPMMRSPHSPAPIQTEYIPPLPTPHGHDLVHSPVQQYEDNPPVYDDNLAAAPGAWSHKS